ncbi:MAG: radical SAM protein [Planctomycetota bacterium]
MPSSSYSFIIPVHDDNILLSHLLPSIRREASGQNPDIIVVADRCSADFLARLRTEIGIRLFETKHLYGPAAARNLGAQKSTSEWLVFLDSDLRMEHGSLRALEEFLANPGSYHSACGVDSDGDLIGRSPAARMMALWVHKTLTDIPLEDSTFFGTRHALVKRELFLRIGEFSVAYERADVEDYEFSVRLSRHTRVKNLRNFLFTHRFPEAGKQRSNYFRRARLYAPLMFRRPSDMGATSGSSGVSVLGTLTFAASLLLFLIPGLAWKVEALGLGLAGLVASVISQKRWLSSLLRREGPVMGSLMTLHFHHLMLLAGLGLITGHLENAGRILLRQMRSVKRLTRFAWCWLHTRSPVYLIFFITGRCNARCPFCFNLETVMNPPDTDLTLEEIERTAKSLPHLVQLTLSGGEPFMRQDIVDLVGLFYTYSGVRNLTIPTNGSLTDLSLARLRDMALRFPELTVRVSVSLDAVGERHNELRRLPGTFDKAVRLLRQTHVLSRSLPNLVTSVISVYSGHNEKDMRELLPWLDENVEVHMQSLLLARGKLDEASAATKASVFDELTADLDRRIAARNKVGSFFGRVVLGKVSNLTRRAVSTLARHGSRKEDYFGCVAGTRLVVLWEDGRVSPCEVITTLDWVAPHLEEHGNFVLGNARDKPVGEILRSAAAAKARDFIRKERCTCTFECAVSASLVFNPREALPAALKA